MHVGREGWVAALLRETRSAVVITTIRRSGYSVEIIPPTGDATKTSLLLGADGYLSTVTDPTAHGTKLYYKDGGLLWKLEDLRGFVHLFDYAPPLGGDQLSPPHAGTSFRLGFLTSDARPGSPPQLLDRNDNLDSSHVTHRSPMGRVTDYSYTGGDTPMMKVTAPGNLVTLSSLGRDGTWSTTFPDGTTSTSTPSTDPRFGEAVMSGSRKVTTISGGGVTLVRTEVVSPPTVTLPPGVADPLSLTAYLQTQTVNGKTWTTNFSKDTTQHTSTVTLTSPIHRQTITTMGALGEVTQVQSPGVAPIVTEYYREG